jgi:hypothetical protein
MMRFPLARAAAAALLAFVGSYSVPSAIAAGEEVAVVVKLGGIPWFNAMEQGIKRAGKEYDPFGGFGRVTGLLLSLLLLQIISTGFNLLGFSPRLTDAIWGATLILGIFLAVVRHRWVSRRPGLKSSAFGVRPSELEPGTLKRDRAPCSER